MNGIFPFIQGFPYSRAHFIELVNLSDEFSVDLKAAASQFALAHPAVAAIVPGTRQPSRVKENVELVKQPIPSEFWESLRSKRLIHPDAPTP